jgi:hypothetical protein
MLVTHATNGLAQIFQMLNVDSVRDNGIGQSLCLLCTGLFGTTAAATRQDLALVGLVEVPE